MTVSLVSITHDLSDDERKALNHVRRHGSDRNMKEKKWRPVFRALYAKGLVKRHIGTWDWIPTQK